MDVSANLKTFIAQTYLKDPSRAIGDDQPLLSSGIIDSFGLVDLSLFIETEFGLVLDPSDFSVDQTDTVRQLSALIRRRLKQ
jgi:acyl carrier protein